MLKPGDQVVARTHFTTIPRVTVQCVHVILMNILNRSSSSALDLQYDTTMETRRSESLLVGETLVSSSDPTLSRGETVW